MSSASESEYGVTVLLPVWMRAADIGSMRELEYSLDSISLQRFPSAYEILIVDDGCETPLTSLVETGVLRVPRHTRFVRQPRNGGLVHALNRGIAAARYPFIARLDADDAWREGKLGKQFALFDADPDLTICGGGMRIHFKGTDRTEDHIRGGSWHEVLRFFVEVGCPFPHGTVLARTAIYRLLGGYPHAPELSHCEDYALWGRWLRFFKPAMVEEIVYDYTASPSSVSSRHAEQQRAASRAVNLEFAGLGITDTLPGLLTTLSDTLGVSLVKAGELAFKLWSAPAVVAVPQASIAPLEALLPDRMLQIQPTSPSLRPRNFVELIGMHEAKGLDHNGGLVVVAVA